MVPRLVAGLKKPLSVKYKKTPSVAIKEADAKNFQWTQAKGLLTASPCSLLQEEKGQQCCSGKTKKASGTHVKAMGYNIEEKHP